MVLTFASLTIMGQNIKDSKVSKSHNGKTLLWEISGNGAVGKSYLYGTMHSTDKQAFEFGDSVLSKLDKSKVIATELDMSPDMIKDFQKYLFMKDGVTLKKLLDSAQYKLVHDFTTKKFGNYNPKSDEFKPYILNMLLSASSTDLNQDMRIPLDKWIQDYAVKRNKKHIPLETADMQMEVFDILPYQKQAQMLVDFIKAPEKVGEYTMEMIRLYKNQDINGLYLILTNEDIMPKEQSEVAFDKRNFKMADQLTQLFKIQSTFCAVGAGHLSGENGLINLLKKKGCIVRPIYSTYSGKNAIAFQQELKWKDTTYKDIKIVVPMPFSTTQRNLTIKGINIPLSTTLFLDSIANNSYAVNIFDYSKTEANLLQDELVSESSLDVARQLNGTLIKETNLNNNKGKELIIQLSGHRFMRMQLFVNGNFGHQLMIVGSHEYIASNEANKFIASNTPNNL